MIIRECVRSYIILAHENIPDEQSPCATITIIAPFIDHRFFEKIVATIRAMCTTDE